MYPQKTYAKKKSLKGKLSELKVPLISILIISSQVTIKLQKHKKKEGCCFHFHTPLFNVR